MKVKMIDGTGRYKDLRVHSVGFVPNTHPSVAGLREANMKRDDLPEYRGTYIVTFDAVMAEHKPRLIDAASNGEDLRPALLTARVNVNGDAVPTIPTRGEIVEEVVVIPVVDQEDNSKPLLSTKGLLSGLPVYNARMVKFYPAKEAQDEFDLDAEAGKAKETESVELPESIATKEGNVIEG